MAQSESLSMGIKFTQKALMKAQLLLFLLITNISFKKVSHLKTVSCGDHIFKTLQ